VKEEWRSFPIRPWRKKLADWEGRGQFFYVRQCKRKKDGKSFFTFDATTGKKKRGGTRLFQRRRRTLREGHSITGKQASGGRTLNRGVFIRTPTLLTPRTPEEGGGACSGMRKRSELKQEIQSTTPEPKKEERGEISCLLEEKKSKKEKRDLRLRKEKLVPHEKEAGRGYPKLNTRLERHERDFQPRQRVNGARDGSSVWKDLFSSRLEAGKRGCSRKKTAQVRSHGRGVNYGALFGSKKEKKHGAPFWRGRKNGKRGGRGRYPKPLKRLQQKISGPILKDA